MNEPKKTLILSVVLMLVLALSLVLVSISPERELSMSGQIVFECETTCDNQIDLPNMDENISLSSNGKVSIYVWRYD